MEMHDPLSPLERRLLGVLVEKGLTSATPEPLTLNAIVVGSNQKSNRDPLMSLEEPEVDDGLEALARKGLVFRITGNRVDRYRHNLYDAWKLPKTELALMAELLLRGPQTAAEARARASRMEPLDNDTATTAIQRLVERGFIVWLAPETRRGAQLTHGFHAPEERQRVERGQPSEAAAMAAPLLLVASKTDEIAVLRAEVAELRGMVVALQRELGMQPPPA